MGFNSGFKGLILCDTTEHTRTPFTVWTPRIPFITITHTPLPSGELKLVISVANQTAS